MLPENRRDCGCRRKCFRRCKKKTVAGLGCLAIGLALLIVCAPGWLIGLVIAAILLAVGASLIGGR